MTVLCAWQSDTAVIVGVADAVGGAVTVTVTVCAATAAMKSINAVETARVDDGVIFDGDRIRKQWKKATGGGGREPAQRGDISAPKNGRRLFRQSNDWDGGC